MNLLSRMSIPNKVLLIPIVGTISFFIFFAINLQAVQSTLEKLDVARTQDFPILIISENNINRLEKVKENLSSAVSTGDEEYLYIAKGHAEQFRGALLNFQTDDSELSSRISDIKTAFNNYFNISFGISRSMVDGSIDFDQLSRKSEEMAQKLNHVESLLQDFNEHTGAQFTSAFTHANHVLDRGIQTGIVMAVVTIVILFSVAIPVSHSLKRNISSIVSALSDMNTNNGDLTRRLSCHSKDELGVLVSEFNQFLDKLQNVIGQVIKVSGPLAELSKTINEHSLHLRKTMEQQQQNTIHTDLSMNEMDQTVKSVAENASEAADAAKLAQEASKEGLGVVQTTVHNILDLSENMTNTAEVVTELESDTSKVNVVLDVIKGIAEQTNLLALNAAIEAARAGEQGRGFAVVADEVRGLASRTQESTEEINRILESLQMAAQSAVQTMQSSTESVKSCVEFANSAGESLDTITRTISNIHLMNSQIAVATTQQEQVTENLVVHMKDINEKTESTFNFCGQLREVADMLKLSADEMVLITNNFRV